MRDRAHRLTRSSVWPWVDPLLGLLLGGLTLVPAIDRLHGPVPWAATLVSCAAIVLAIAIRIHHALTAVVGCCLVLVAGSVAHGQADVSDASLLAVVLLAYSAASRLSVRQAYIGVAVAIATVVAVSALAPGDFDPVPAFVFVIPVAFCGRALRRWRLLNVALEQRAAALAEGREAHAALAVADERMRIARELHDVVGHAVSLMVVQATAGRRVADRRPEDARRALDTIEQAGDRALVELAQLAALVAHDSMPATLEGLVADARGAGLEVSLRTPPGEAPPPLVTRVVQEALTNALKHAGPTDVEIELRRDAEVLVVRVTDSGPRRAHVPAIAVTGGHGLVGMCERVALAGGTLRAAPLPAGGWEVLARVPAEVRAAAPDAVDVAAAVR